MDFEKEKRTVEFLSPSLQWGAQVQQVEYRRDPLTGSHSRLNLGRAGRVRQAERDEFDLTRVVKETAVGCYFCPENLERETPKFPGELYGDGRIRRGECTIFPNLFPFAEHHAVGILSQKHYVELDGFTTQMLMDNLLASMEYFSLVYRNDASARYPMWVWNHMPPSGASIIHPHVQIALEQAPTPEVGRLLEKSGDYLRRHGRSYWQDLVKEEKERGERYVAELGSLALLATYAPRGNNEIQFIFRDGADLLALGEAEVRDFATAVVRVLTCYKEMGMNSFNLITYSAAVHQNPEYYALNARIVSRPVFRPFYTNDTGFMERFFDAWVIETPPEEVARFVRERF